MSVRGIKQALPARVDLTSGIEEGIFVEGQQLTATFADAMAANAARDRRSFMVERELQRGCVAVLNLCSPYLHRIVYDYFGSLAGNCEDHERRSVAREIF